MPGIAVCNFGGATTGEDRSYEKNQIYKYLLKKLCFLCREGKLVNHYQLFTSICDAMSAFL